MDLIKRTQCTICNLSIDKLFTFKNFPVSMGISKSEDQYIDQDWCICSYCGCIQLENLIPIETLYKHPHNPAIGNSWANHNESFSKFVLNNSWGNIIEIGGGNGKIAKLIAPNRENQYLIFDKHLYSFIHDSVVCSGSFYDPCERYSFSCGTIISSHMVEHMYNPRDYFQSFYEKLPAGGRVIFSFPNITAGLTDKFLNTLNFEHTYQIDPSYLKCMMESNGFRLICSEEFTKYNQFMCFEKYKISHQDHVNRYQTNKRIFNEFIASNLDEADKIISLICDSKKKRYIFGCHVFSQYLLHFGLNKIQFDGIIDNDPNKIGKRLYGTNLKVFPSSIVSDIDSVVVVRAGIYTNEVIDTLKSFNRDCEII